jgi:hypothetical protein
MAGLDPTIGRAARVREPMAGSSLAMTMALRAMPVGRQAG